MSGRQLIGMFSADDDPDAIADAILARVTAMADATARPTSTEQEFTMTAKDATTPAPQEQSSADRTATRIAAAAAFAIDRHGSQLRKGTKVPYWTHLAAVAGLVAEHGGSTEQTMAAWLHDVVEDTGGMPVLVMLRVTFGDHVATIVEQLSDSLVEDRADKLPWRQRKEEYVATLAEHHGHGSMLVSLADKLHNAEATVADLEDPSVGLAVLGRFKAKGDDLVWQWESLVKAFEADTSLPEGMTARLRAAAQRICDAARSVPVHG